MTDLRKLLDEATPGPWEAAIERGCHGVIAHTLPAGGANFVAIVWNNPESPEKEPSRFANARLIALAPQAFAALIKAKEGLEGIERTYYTEGKDAVWRSVQMRAISNATLAEIDALMGGKDD